MVYPARDNRTGRILRKPLLEMVMRNRFPLSGITQSPQDKHREFLYARQGKGLYCDSPAVSMVRSVLCFTEGFNFPISFSSSFPLLCSFPLCPPPSIFLPSRCFSPPLFSGFHTHNQLPLSTCFCPSSSPALPSSSQRFWFCDSSPKAQHTPSPKPSSHPLPVSNISELFLALLEIRTEIKQLSRDKESPSLSDYQNQNWRGKSKLHY